VLVEIVAMRGSSAAVQREPMLADQVPLLRKERLVAFCGEALFN